VTDGRTLAELGRAVDRVERDLHENYVRKDIFEARVGPLERDKTSRRNALLAVAGTIAGVLASALITYLITKGGGH
jgi:hypothetical protein